MTPEGKVKAKVKRLLARYPVYSHWPVQTGYGSPTLDCIVCAAGHFFAIETKAPGKKPTPRQEQTIKAMRDAGALVFIIDGDCVLLERQLDYIFQPKAQPHATSTDIPQAQAGRRAKRTRAAEPVAYGEAVRLPGPDASVDPARPARDFHAAEAGFRCARSDFDALLVEWWNALRGTAQDVRADDAQPARLRAQRDGYGEDEGGAVGVGLPAE